MNFENCRIEGYRLNIQLGARGDPPIRPTGIALRRSTILDAFTPYPQRHAIGILAEATDDLLIEECIFDKNGWSDTRVLSKAALDGGSNWLVLSGRARDRYGEDLQLKVTSGPASSDVRIVTASYGTDGQSPDEIKENENTITLGSSASDVNDFYVADTGQPPTVIRLMHRPGHEAEITAYDGANKTATLSQNWSQGFGDGEYYTIEGHMVPMLVVDAPFTAQPGPADFELSGFFGTSMRHNTYIQNNCTDVVMRANISARSSANGFHLRPGGLLDANLSLRNPIGITLGHSGIQGTGTARNNVVLDTMDIPDYPNPDPRGAGMYNDAMKDMDIYGNVIAHAGGDAGDIVAIHITDIAAPAGGVENVRIFQNRLWDWCNWNTDEGDLIDLNANQSYTNLDIFLNHLQQPFAGYIVPGHSTTCLSGVNWDDNTVWSVESGLSSWVQACTSNTTVDEVQYTHTDRDIGTYMNELGLPGELEEFIAEARQLERGNWDERFTATAVINFVRAGFDLPPMPLRERRDFYQIDPVTGQATRWPPNFDRPFIATDFGGIDIDATGRMFGVSTRIDPTEPTTGGLYELELSSPPHNFKLLAPIDLPEMEGLSAGIDLYIVTGEDKAILRYDYNGAFLGTVALPPGFDVGGTFAGAAVLGGTPPASGGP